MASDAGTGRDRATVANITYGVFFQLQAEIWLGLRVGARSAEANFTV